MVYPDNSVLCPANIIGELWVSSPSLPVGFWKLPQESIETFEINPLILGSDGETQPLYEEGKLTKTGLVGFVSSDKLWIVGHLDDQIRYMDEGGNISHYFAREITNTVLTHAPEIEFWYYFLNQVLLSA